MLRLVLFGLVLQQAAGVIYRLTPAEYDRLPKLLSIDEYAACMRAPGDAYCFVRADLRGNRSDPLYDTLVEYTASVITHFNHTKLWRGICPKRSCAAHMQSSSNLTLVVETCLNESLHREYRLTARVSEALCEHYRARVPWDAGDVAYGAVVLALLSLNLLGSLFDFFCAHGRETFGGRFLLCFAVRSNWRRLAAPPSAHSMHRRVKVIYSMRTITAFGVVMGHSPLPALLLGNDSQFLEETYHRLPYHIIYNGTLIVQTFFLISGFLLAYNIMLSEEKRPTTWQSLPKAIVLRWLRLTPAYAMVMFYVMTWARHVANGPFALKSLSSESWDCHQNWWRHLLYIHNYKDNSQCMVHGWYLGADFQLTVVGLAIFCLLRSVRSRKLAIGAVVLLGLLTPAAHTLLQNLHAFLVVSPEVAVDFFVEDRTFNNLYKRGHTNLVCYGIGLVMAYSVYNLKESDLGADKYKKFRVLYWLLLPLLLSIALVCAVFYIDGLVVPVATRAVFASGVKLVYGFLTALFIFFTIVKVDSAYRGLLHWGGWAPLSRLTYMAYLVHVPLLRFSVANSDELIPIGFYWMVQNFASCVVISFALAVPLFLLVELPMAELVKLVMLPAPARAEKTRPDAGDDVVASKETLEMKL